MSDSVFSLAGWPVVRLRPQDAPELQSLFERCSDYVELYSGAPPGPAEAEEALSSLPAGKELTDKLSLGLYRLEGSIVGYVDLVRDHPAEHEWWLGLLVLDPAARGRGLGGRLYDALARWVASRHGRTLWIGVLEENAAAERFWRRRDFIEVRRQPSTADSGKEHTLIVLRHDITLQGGDGHRTQT